MSVVGVDGCKKGWIAVALHDDGEVAAHFLRHIRDIVEITPTPTVIGIDMPIGLPVTGRRRADEEARAQLGVRRSSVFFTPPRAALIEVSHELATRRAVELTGGGISRQSYGLASKILELDEWLPNAPCRVLEVHPEVCFAVMLGRPALASKKTWHGMIERRGALADEGIVLDRITGAAAVNAAVDDMLDAGAAAWSARRISLGTARSFPDPPEDFGGGESAAIWA